MTPSEEEIAHGESVIMEIADDVRVSKYTSVPIDHACGWPTANGKCLVRIDRCTFILYAAGIQVAAYCNHHADCMDAAYAKIKSAGTFTGDFAD